MKNQKLNKTYCTIELKENEDFEIEKTFCQKIKQFIFEMFIIALLFTPVFILAVWVYSS